MKLKKMSLSWGDWFSGFALGFGIYTFGFYLGYYSALH